MTKESKHCFLVSSLILFGAAFICFMAEVAAPLIEQGYTSKQDCKVNNIKYPQSVTNSTSDDWVDCDCGKRCTTNTACLRIYVDYLDKKNILMLKHVIRSKSNGDTCTFKRGDCGETLDDIQYSVDEAKDNAKIFENYKNDSKSFDCYVNKDKSKVYYERDLSFEHILGFSIFLGVSFLILIICGIYYFIKNQKEKKELNDLLKNKGVKTLNNV